jgi:hypothetical protein
MTSISKPMEVEILEKELRTLEIELEAKKTEIPNLKKASLQENEKIQKIEKEIASKKEQL